MEDVYQWVHTSQNFVSAEPDTLRKADYMIEDLYRLLTWDLYCIHGSKSIDLNGSLADIDEFSILFVCLYRSVRGGNMLVHEQLMDRSRLI